MTEDSDAEFINKEFLQEALQNYTKDPELHVTDFSQEHATAKGDNYMSFLYRVTVEYTTRKRKKESKSVIIKVAPTGVGATSEMVEEMSMFPREIKMMTDTLVKMNERLKSIDEDVLSADVYYFRLESPELLVVEDLKTLGFGMADRFNGLDLFHAELAMRNLARFHASSIHFLENEEHDMEMYRSRLYCSGATHAFRQYVEQGLKALAKEVESWPEVDQSYAEKLLKLAEVLYDRCYHVINDEHEFRVINHGDCWVNNMMFRYDEYNMPIQQIFVDFQICCYASPAYDITYLFSTSLTEELYQFHRDHLLDVYLETLSSVMKGLGCKGHVITMDQLKADLVKFGILELLMTFTFRPIVTSRKEDAANADELFEGEEKGNVNILKNPAFVEVVIDRLPMFEEMGLFE